MNTKDSCQRNKRECKKSHKDYFYIGYFIGNAAQGNCHTSPVLRHAATSSLLTEIFSPTSQMAIFRYKACQAYMNLNHTFQVNKTFAQDVLKGLSASPKSLSSKYFYNEKGDGLFQAIMGMDEYYLTRSEFAILAKYKNDLLQLFKEGNAAFELIEFGAGDGYKTKILLEHFQEMEAYFRYLPVDISSNVLEILVDDLKKNIPDLKVAGIQGDYFKSLGNINASSQVKKVVLFWVPTLAISVRMKLCVSCLKLLKTFLKMTF